MEEIILNYLGFYQFWAHLIYIGVVEYVRGSQKKLILTLNFSNYCSPDTTK